MNKTCIAALISIIVGIESCTIPSVDEATEISIDLSQSEVLRYSDYYSLSRIIFPDSTQVFSNFERAELTDDYLVILHGSPYYQLLIYHLATNDLTIIKAQGEGPEEYKRISNFDIDTSQDRIYLLDNTQGKLLVYTLDGVLEEVITSKHLLQITSFKVGNEGNVWCYGGNLQQGLTNHRLFLWESKADTITTRYFNIPAGEKNLLFLESNNFQSYRGEIYFSHVYNRGIYHLDGRGVQQNWTVNFGGANLPENAFKDKEPALIEAIQWMNQEGKVMGFSNLSMSDWGCSFTFQHEMQLKMAIFNKEMHRATLFTQSVNDLVGIKNPLEINYLDIPLASNGNRLVFVLEPEDLLSKWKEGYLENAFYQQYHGGIKSDSNPILLILEQK
jgi:hypothetical protein